MKLDSETIATLGPWLAGLPIERVRLVHRGPICWFVRRILRQGAMTVSPFIFFGRGRFDPAEDASIALLAHELKHVEQYRRMGYARFLLRYLLDLARNRFRYSRSLPLEAECYALQAEVMRALTAHRHDASVTPHVI